MKRLIPLFMILLCVSGCNTKSNPDKAVIAHELQLPRSFMRYSIADYYLYREQRDAVHGRIEHIFTRQAYDQDRVTEESPRIIISSDSLHKNLSSLLYAADARRKVHMNDIVECKTHIDGITPITSAVYVRGNSIDDETKTHTSYILFTFTYGSFGVSVICSAPRDKFAAVAPEFDSFIQSLELVTDEKTVELKQKSIDGYIYIVEANSKITLAKAKKNAGR